MAAALTSPEHRGKFGRAAVAGKVSGSGFAFSASEGASFKSWLSLQWSLPGVAVVGGERGIDCAYPALGVDGTPRPADILGAFFDAESEHDVFFVALLGYCSGYDGFGDLRAKIDEVVGGDFVEEVTGSRYVPREEDALEAGALETAAA